MYGFSADTFLRALQDAGVSLLLDVRQRRGVRGPDYAWANAKRLQAALAEAGIAYEHRRDLAPTTELRQLQYTEDARLGEGKRSRTVLAGEYVRRYTAEILDEVDLREVVGGMPERATTALLCVERDAIACHRSLIAKRLQDDHGLTFTHLVP